MWYGSYFSGGAINIWYAESQNGIGWHTIGSNPVLTKGTSGSWDDYGVVPSLVMKINNQYRMYYMGSRGLNEMLNIGLALSSDGINWTKYGAPVMAATSQYYMIALSNIIIKDSTYLAYFNYNNSRSGSNNKIGMATSYDGINWTMYANNPILSATLTWEGGSIYFPTVVLDNNQYQMVYSNALQQNAFGMAISTDGYNFTKQSTPFFINSNTTENYVQIAYPDFKKLNSEYRIYYTGQAASGELSINLLKIPN